MNNKLEEQKYIINLESDRLLLRNMKELDKEFIVKLWTDPDVAKYMGGPRDEGKMIEILKELLENPYLDEYDLWVLTEKRTGRPVGHCGLLMKEVEGKSEIEVVYVIDKAYWGKGYATEVSHMLIDYAFNTKNLKRVIALIKPGNKGSEAVALKNGMRLEKELIRDNNVKMYLYVKEMEFEL